MKRVWYLIVYQIILVAYITTVQPRGNINIYHQRDFDDLIQGFVSSCLIDIIVSFKPRACKDFREY